MIEGSCHCGAVRIEVEHAPETVTQCNCSICRRVGALYAYYRPAEVKISAAPDATVAYVWGDRMLALHHCRVCGCTTHSESIVPEYSHRMAVNARLFEPGVLKRARVRRFDGADSWTFLDEA